MNFFYDKDKEGYKIKFSEDYNKKETYIIKFNR